MSWHHLTASVTLTGYQNFNTAAKKLDRRLQALGAVPLLPKGLADDQQTGGYDTTLDSWLPQLWTQLRQHIPSGQDAAEVPPHIEAQECCFRVLCSIWQPPCLALHHDMSHVHACSSGPDVLSVWV